jgi:hypothetical protein
VHRLQQAPAIILKEDRGKILVAFLLEDFVQWSQALAEVGQRQAIRSTIRQAKRLLEEAEGMAR